MSDDAELFRGNLNAFCLKQGWISRKNVTLGSPGELQKRLGKTVSFWSDLLRGEKSFSSDLARSIEQGLGMRKYSLAGDQETTPFVEVMRTNVRLAAGSGAIEGTYEELGGLSFRKDFLRSCGVIKPENARIVDVDGTSMEPTIPDGAVLLVNIANREPFSGKVFALAKANEGLVVKRLIKHGDVWMARSDNPDGNPDFQINDSIPVTIIGRAVWMGAKI